MLTFVSKLSTPTRYVVLCGDKISMIKAVRLLTGSGLKEAKDAVEAENPDMRVGFDIFIVKVYYQEAHAQEIRDVVNTLTRVGFVLPY